MKDLKNVSRGTIYILLFCLIFLFKFLSPVIIVQMNLGTFFQNSTSLSD